MPYNPHVFPYKEEKYAGMLSFELSKALSGKWKIVTRSGIEIPYVHFFEGSDITNPVCGVMNGDVENWTVEGKYFSDRNNSAYDLFLKKKTKVVWANVYPTGLVFNTEEAADYYSARPRISGKAIRIEYEE